MHAQVSNTVGSSRRGCIWRHQRSILQQRVCALLAGSFPRRTWCAVVCGLGSTAAGGTSCSLQHAITWRSFNNSSVTVPASQGYACESQGYWFDALLRICFLPPGHGLESLLQAMAAVIAKVWIGGQATKFSRMAL